MKWFRTISWPAMFGICVMQGGLRAADISLLQWEWWFIVTGAIIYATATAQKAQASRK